MLQILRYQDRMPHENVLDKVKTSGFAVDSACLMAVAAASHADSVDDFIAGSEKLLGTYLSIYDLRNLDFYTLNKYLGLEVFDAYRFLSAFHLGRRCGESNAGERPLVNDPDAIYEHLMRKYKGERQEYFLAILADAKGKLIKVAEIHKGTLTASLVGPREVFREAVKEGAASVVVAHNHPSGDPEPSPNDLAITEKLKQVGDMLDITLLDHIIIGAHSFFSMKRKGLI